ncbi:TPA: phage minor tail protein L [Klebsiella aerogenes]|nr:phage minor tail protein L [Klebsiella aerogenes]
MITSDLQKLEPGAKVRLFIVDGSAFGAEPLYFHPYALAHTPEEIAAAGGDESKLQAKPLFFGGQEFSAWPCQITGLESSSDGAAAEPVLSVGNIYGSITALCLRFEDMAQAKVTIIDTFARYLDDGATPDTAQAYRQTWYIDSKTGEDGEVVGFKLSSPIDLQGRRAPTRQITALCTWAVRGQYRSGDGCGYTGTVYLNLKGEPVSDPALDKCSGCLVDCKKRFGEFAPLDFGGFPGAALLRR